MARIENAKLSIVGAGSVGTSLAYASLIRGSARTIALYDKNTTKVEAETLDLAHGSHFAGSSRIIGSDDPAVVAGSNMVVITAGARQKPGQSRLDLAGTNVEILRSMLPTLLEHAPDAIYVIVTNPCDVLTVAAQQITGLPTERVFSTGTVLDTSRLRRLIADRAQVSTASVHADIVGEHGDTSFALWSQARIGPVPLLDWTAPDGHHFVGSELEQITEDVRTAAYRVIEGKGSTNYAIGLAGARIIEAVFDDQHAVLPVGSVHQDYRGISGVSFSIPSVVGRDGVEQVLDLTMTRAEERQLMASAEALRGVQHQLGIG